MEGDKEAGDENPLLGSEDYAADADADVGSDLGPQEPVESPSRWPAPPCNATTYTVALLLVTTACLYADQNIIAPNMSAIALEFKLNDEARMLQLYTLACLMAG